MNSKATKQQIAVQFNLNLYNDNPHIDNTFSNVERNNAPFLNDMLQPVWIKDLGQEYIHDADGNRYHIENNTLYKNDVELFEIENKKFVREEIDMTDVRAYDFDDNNEVKVYWETENNRFRIVFNENEYYTESLYSEGVVISQRVRLIDGSPWFVVHYDVADVPYIYIWNEETIWNDELKWYRQKARVNTSSTVQSMFELREKENADTIIHIGNVYPGVIGISLITDRNKAIDTCNNYFATYFIKDKDVKQLGRDIYPVSNTSTQTITNSRTIQLRMVDSQTKQNKSGVALSNDATTFYDYTTVGVLGNNLNIPVTYSPIPTSETVEIEGVTYTKYNYTATEHTYKLYVTQQGTSEEFKVVAEINNEEIESELNDSQKELTYQDLQWSGEDYIEKSFGTITVTWNGEESTTTLSDLPKSKLFTITQTYESTVNAGWVVTPNIVLDSGDLYAMYYFPDTYPTGNTWNGHIITAGNLIEESGFIQSWNDTTYTVGVTEYVTLTSDYNVIRANSVIALQNFFVSTVRLNNASATGSYYYYNEGGTARTESTASIYLEYSNSNVTDLRYYPGTNNDTNFNYFGFVKYNGTAVGPNDDLLPFVEQGYRVPVHSANRYLLGSKASPWNILYNVDSSNNATIRGISYSSSQDHMGTLLTTLTSVAQDFYVACNSKSIIYKDVNNHYFKISIEEGNELSALLDDRYILVNTTSYYNMYDSYLGIKLHYATDYNGRLMYGQIATPTPGLITTTGQLFPGAITSGSVNYTRMTGDGINAGFRLNPKVTVSSAMLPVQTRIRVLVDAERAYGCTVEESSSVQPIDIYYGNVGDTTAKYQYSYFPFRVYDRKFRFELDGSTYAVSSVLFNTNIFAEFISGAGNYDMVRDGLYGYVLYYYNQTPYFLYTLTSEATNIGLSTEYFVLQGQFYSYQNDKIYSMIYSNGSIAQQDAIVDCRGMVFLGNNTQVAFFYSPSKRMIYSFTGDAILQSIWPASKIKSIENKKHWYDEMTQSIYIATDYGLLVLGQKNNYLFDNWKNVTNVQISRDSVTHITNDGTTIDLVYYEKEGFEILPLDLETSFFGLGSNEYTSIDRWDITLFDNNGLKAESYIKVGVRSITDITVKSEEKLYKITPEMYDKWSDSILIRYVPKLQKGQGIRLYIKTPLTVQKIVPHISDLNTGTLTKRGL